MRFKDRSIAKVLELDIQQALGLFENVPQIRHKLQTLHDVGLDYMKLGQPSPTLSGGEAQRIKLADELTSPGFGPSLYVLDEPTTGLHMADVAKLVTALQRLVDRGDNTWKDGHLLQMLKVLPWDRWRTADPESTIRFHALRLHEAGLIKSSPQQIIRRGTDWRFLNEVKKEMKG